MPAPGFEWLTSWLQTFKLFNLQSGLIYFGIGASVSAFNYATSAEPNPAIFEDRTFAVIMIVGAVVSLVDLGRIVLERRRVTLSDRKALATKQRIQESKAARIADIVVANMWSITDNEIKRTLIYLLRQKERRFSVGLTSETLDALVGKNIVHASGTEDGVFSKGTYLVHPAIWEIRGDFLNANQHLLLGQGRIYIEYRR
ncbi:hypothetical protein RLEG12_32995 [Rhizobium leguminosarum bv. trifolii CB782]|nr:hypothetical protein RLEG12_32995 [Rhizobium leguminosarum bv. trifolii CB782]